MTPKSFVDLIDEWQDKTRPEVYGQPMAKGDIPYVTSGNVVVGLAAQPLTHAERRSYRAMKAWVASKHIVLQVVQVPPYTMVAINYCWLRGTPIDRYGFSKCAPGDAWDADRGVQIATGRAVAAIARALMLQTEAKG